VGKWLVVSVVVEALAKLTLYGSILLLFVGLPSGALATTRAAGLVAIVAAALGFARTWLRGELLARQLESLYAALAAATRGKKISNFTTHEEGQQPSDLVHCAVEVATVQALSVPDLIASFIGVALLLALTAWRLGFALLAAGLLGSVALLMMLAPLRRRSREARETGWSALVGSTKSFTTLVKGAFELRGSGLDHAVEQRFMRHAQGVARAERRSMLLGGVSGLLPALLAIALFATPVEWMAPWLGARLGEVGVLAAAGINLTLSATSALDAVTRNAPLRRDLGIFLGETLGWRIDARLPSARMDIAAGPRITSLELAQISVRYAGADIATPSDLDLSLSHGGVALVGPNGSGKTSALLVALGLMESQGSVKINGKLVNATEWPALRKRCAVVPQRPHIVPDETIRFHMSGYGTAALSDTDLERALEPMAVVDRLRERAGRAKVALGELQFSALSGGEQRRILLAASALRPADLLLFDEPEAGLDESGRALARDLFEHLSKDRLVLLAAHDPTVIPASFARVVVHRAG
jgi:ABC-type transport system involved in cytochrome bd biosynthesis fused ATPase/permease subunit